MIPDWAAPFGVCMIHSVSLPRPWLAAAAAGWSGGKGAARNSRSGTRPAMTRIPATRRMVASVFRARKARNAAEAMKKASSAKMVDWSGWNMLSAIH